MEFYGKYIIAPNSFGTIIIIKNQTHSEHCRSACGPFNDKIKNTKKNSRIRVHADVVYPGMFRWAALPFQEMMPPHQNAERVGIRRQPTRDTNP